MKHLRLLPFLLLIVVIVSSCRSSRIPSEGNNSSMLTSKRALSEALLNEITRNPINTYLSKNAVANVSFNGSSHSVKLNLYFEYSKKTVGIARLAFPPLMVGKLTMDTKNVSVNSSLLNVNKDFTLPFDISTFLHDAIVGRVPAVYNLYGDSDFSAFNMSITSDNLYLISRKSNGLDVKLYINPDLTLHSYTISYLSYIVSHVNNSFDTFDGRHLPNDITLSVVLPGATQPTSTNFQFSKITINGTDKLN